MLLSLWNNIELTISICRSKVSFMNKKEIFIKEIIIFLKFVYHTFKRTICWHILCQSIDIPQADGGMEYETDL